MTGIVPVPLQTKTFALGGTDGFSLRDIPKSILGKKFTHVVGILFKVVFTPTTTALPTVVQSNNIVASMDVTDGSMLKFSGGFNELRQMERIQAGGLRLPDLDVDTASGTARHWRRVLYFGPPQMIGKTDFAIPAALLANGEIRLRWAGALTDFASDCTNATGTVQAIALCIGLDEIRIPPAYQFSFLDASAKDINLPGQCLYTEIAMLNSSSHDAIAAGDFANLNLDAGEGDLLNGVAADVLTGAFNADFGRGDVDSVLGEPGVAADTSSKAVNHTSPTALVDQSPNLQPVLWVPPSGKITKLPRAGSVARLRWSGSQSTARILYGRILEQGPQLVDTLTVKALGAAAGGRPPSEMKVKTASKKDFARRDYLPFMPYKVGV